MAIHTSSDPREIKRIKAAVNDLLKAMGMKPLPQWADGFDISIAGFKQETLVIEGSVTNRQSADLGDH